MFRISVLTVALVAAAPFVSAANDKDLVRSQAKENAAKLRALGEPLDRCSLGISVGPGPHVVRTDGPSVLLHPGDKLVAMDGASLAGKSQEDVIAVLRKTAPSSSIAVTAERDGKNLELQVHCTNSKPNYDSLLKALDFAASGKFDECVRTISQMPRLDTFPAGLRMGCAGVSRNASRDAAGYAVTFTQMSIEDAHYSPEMRAPVIKQLQALEGVITRGQGPARYQALVDATKQWPGGETLFESSTPDWALFRRNAETSLRNKLIDPDSAKIEWQHGFLLGTWKPLFSKVIEGYWTCGLINARNRMGGYTGASAFVVVLDPTGIVKYSQIGDSREFDLLAASCQGSMKLLPPAPSEMTADDATHEDGRSRSLADELTKLVALRDSGALSESEFQAAKAKLLSDGTQ